MSIEFRVNSDIINERVFQVNKWGLEQALVKEMGFDKYIHVKVSVLAEEFGEFAKEVNDRRLDEMYKEAVQVAAVAKAICEGILFVMEDNHAV